MIERIGTVGANNRQDLIGSVTDEKPTDVGYGSTFIEDASGNMFIFSPNMNPETSNGWWPI